MERFMVYAFIMGRQFLIRSAKRYMELIYKHREDDEIRRILGESPIEMLPGETIARYKAFKKVDYQELDEYYDIVPVDVFTEENKKGKALEIMNFVKTVAELKPNYNPDGALKMVGKLLGFSSPELYEILGGAEGAFDKPISPAETGLGFPSQARISKGDRPQPSPSQPDQGPFGIQGMAG